MTKTDYDREVYFGRITKATKVVTLRWRAVNAPAANIWTEYFIDKPYNVTAEYQAQEWRRIFSPFAEFDCPVPLPA